MTKENLDGGCARGYDCQSWRRISGWTEKNGIWFSEGNERCHHTWNIIKKIVEISGFWNVRYQFLSFNDICLLWAPGPDSLSVFLEQLNNHYLIHFPLLHHFSGRLCPHWPRSILLPLSVLNLPTPNNSSTITTVTPHQPNIPSLTPLPLEGTTSVTTLMTSQFTPPTSVESSLLGVTQFLSSKNSYSMSLVSEFHKMYRFSEINFMLSEKVHIPWLNVACCLWRYDL